MLRDTSLDNYVKLKESGKLGQQEKKVYDLYKQYPQSTDKEISEYSGLPINIVTGRRNKLVEKGYICDLGVRSCSITGNTSHYWGVSK